MPQDTSDKNKKSQQGRKAARDGFWKAVHRAIVEADLAQVNPGRVGAQRSCSIGQYAYRVRLGTGWGHRQLTGRLPGPRSLYYIIAQPKTARDRYPQHDGTPEGGGKKRNALDVGFCVWEPWQPPTDIHRWHVLTTVC